MGTIFESPALAASISAIVVAVLNYLTRRLELRDRSEQRAAVLAMHRNSAALDALASLSPQSGKINSGPIILLAIGFAAAIYNPAPLFASDADSGRECSTASDCKDGDRCERGRCVSNARKPKLPRKASATEEDGLALWWSPRTMRRDPFEPIWASY